MRSELVRLCHGIVCFWWFSSGDRVLGVVALVVGGFLAIGSGGCMDPGVSAVSVFLGGVGLFLEALVDSVLSVRLREGETNLFRRKVTSVVARPCYITRVPYGFYCFYW